MLAGLGYSSREGVLRARESESSDSGVLGGGVAECPVRIVANDWATLDRRVLLGRKVRSSQW